MKKTDSELTIETGYDFSEGSDRFQMCEGVPHKVINGTLFARKGGRHWSVVAEIIWTDTYHFQKNLEMTSYAELGSVGHGGAYGELEAKFKKVQENYHSHFKENYDLIFKLRHVANGSIFEVYFLGQLMCDWSLLSDRNGWTLMTQSFKVVTK